MSIKLVGQRGKRVTAEAEFDREFEGFDHNRSLTEGCLEPPGAYVEFKILHCNFTDYKVNLRFTCKVDEFEKLAAAVG